MELGYWNVKGRAELLRILLAYFGFPYKEVNPSSRQEAMDIFAKHHFNFPNLPYLVDGDVHITESSAIPVYLAHKAGRPEFFGKQGLDHVHHQEVLGVLHDLLEVILQTVSREDHSDFFHSKKDFLLRKLGDISRFLGEKEFLLGYITYADFVLAGVVGLQRKIAGAIKAEPLDTKFPNLKALSDRVYGLPGVKEHVTSAQSQARPFLPPSVVKLQL